MNLLADVTAGKRYIDILCAALFLIAENAVSARGWRSAANAHQHLEALCFARAAPGLMFKHEPFRAALHQLSMKRIQLVILCLS